jgi:PST family polysaccharide transporter
MQFPYDYRFLDLKKVVFQNASAIILGRIANLILSVASSVLLVRYLGSKGIGQYASVYAYLMLFNWLTTLGMEYIIVRDSAKQQEYAAQLFGTASIASFAFSITAMLLAMLGSVIFGYGINFQTLLFIGAIDMFLLVPLRLSSSVFQLHLKQWYTTVISFTRQILWLAVILVLILIKANLLVIISGRLFCSIIESLILFVCARKLMPFKWHFRISVLINILRSSWPIALSALCSFIYQRIDQVMLHSLAGNQKLGYYTVAVNITELFTIFAVAIMSPMFPILSEATAEKKRFEYYVRLCFRYLMTFLFGVCAIITIGSPLLIRLLYGGEFISSAGILSVLIWSEAGVFLGMIIGLVLTVQGRQKYIPLTAFMGALINIILNAVFIPRYAGLGAAWASVISYSLTGFFFFFLFPATWSLLFAGLKASLRPLIIALIGVGIFAHMPKLTALPLVTLFYLTGFFIFSAYKKEDIAIIFNLLGLHK